METTHPALILCPDCDAFPFDSEEELAEHRAGGDHAYGDRIALRLRLLDVTAPVDGPSVDAPERHEAGSGARRAAPAPDEASDRQVAFLGTLLAEAGLHDELAALGQGRPSKREASRRIDALVSAKKATEATADRVRTNRYSAPCARCSIEVPAGCGELAKTGGRWVTTHHSCPSHADVVVEVVDESPVEAGMYRTEDGAIYRVREGRQSGRLYAMRLVEDGDGGYGFEFAPGMMRRLSSTDRMTVDEAKAFGKQTGTCCVCGRLLTNETSVKEGIGPVCGGRV